MPSGAAGVYLMLLVALGGVVCTSSSTAPSPQPTIVAYTWAPVTPAADRLIYAIKVERGRADARRVAAALRAMPPGHRAIRLRGWTMPDLTRHPDDRCRGPDGTLTEFWYPKPEAGVDLVRSRWRAFLQQLRAAGAPLDEVIVDFEMGYNIRGRGFGPNKTTHLAAIQNDPRFGGLKSREADDLVDLAPLAGCRRPVDCLTWNAVMRGVVDAALEASLYEPLREVYPDTRCSNFHSHRVRRDLAIPDPNGRLQWAESDCFGTHDGISAYGGMRSVTQKPLRDGKPLGATPYAALLYTIKSVEAVANSSSRPLKVWVAPRDWRFHIPTPFTGTPYHDELLRHLIVRRHGLLLFNAKVNEDDEQMLHTNAILNECAHRIGERGSSRSHTTPWSAKILQSTTTRGERVVHRFTLEHPQRPLRYRINDVAYERYPLGGEVGLWVEHGRRDQFVHVE